MTDDDADRTPGDGPVVDDPGDEADRTRGDEADRTRGDEAPGAEEAPLAAAAERAARRRAERDGDAERAADDAATDQIEEYFEDESVADIDTEQLWERLADGESPEVGIDERTVREIDAHRYCHQCEHFSEPPEVACAHEGTTIIEMPSLSRFRVTNCPVVREEEALEDGSSGP